MTATLTTQLHDLAEQINREHNLCERAYDTALAHAYRAGELLTQAKGQVGHGGWLPWLEQHFDGAQRTAQGYMQLAANPRRVADLDAGDIGLRATLKAISRPQPAPEHPDAPAADPDLLADRLRAGQPSDASHALAELHAVEREQAPLRFPRPGVQRTTWRQITDQLGLVDRRMREATSPDLTAAARGELLGAAAGAAREAGELLDELAIAVRAA